MPSQRPQGNFTQADFFDNLAGLNITDSPFRVQSSQAVAGYNYDYTATGGLKKRNGHTRLNASANTQLRSLGFGLQNTTTGTKKVVRAAGTKLQVLNTSDGTTTDITDDLASPASDFFTSTQPVVFSQFVTTSLNGLWAAGGGLASGTVLGYNGTHATVNGAAAPTGTISGAASGADGTLPAGDYYYAAALVKASTGAISNAALDIKVTVGATNHVVITLSSLTGLDPTKYSNIRIYRSAISGVTGFTTGDLAGTVASTATSFTDTGTVQGTGLPVPRAGNSSLDNSVLPSGTYNVLTTWKRRLVTAAGSTLWISDLNKPESWPTVNSITLPSGGPITALGIISFNTPTTTATNEYLVVFKENECWVVTGSTVSDWSLLFISYNGCPAQPLVVSANGFLLWLDYRGAWLWDGANKPIYVSRLIEYDFSVDGDIDRSKLTEGCGAFFKKQNEVIWFLSSISLGEQVLSLKLDLRLTLPGMTSEVVYGRILEGVFLKDSLTYPIYACQSTSPTYDETFYGGGAEGFIWKLFDNPNSDNGAVINFTYRTRPEDLGTIGTTKRFHKIIVWCRQSTINNLTLNYWVSYQTDAAHKATQVQRVTDQVTNAEWDQATWDSFSWDSNLVTYTPVVFNLGNSSVGVEGDVIALEFQQADANSPIIIAGYSIIYTASGLRK